MTDYAGEQEMEIEACQAILGEDMEVFEGTSPDGWGSTERQVVVYKVHIDPTEEEDQTGEPPAVLADMLFAHTPEYPDVPPHVKLRAVRGLGDADIAAANRMLAQQIEENLGMAMVFTLVSAARDWLRAKIAGTNEVTVDPDVARKKANEEEEARRSAARAHGTPVNTEVFLAWKAKFDAEMLAAKLKAAEALKDDEKARRVSGKFFFQKQAATEEGAGDDFEIDEDFELDEEERGGVDMQDAEEEFDYDDDDEDGDVEDLLEQYLAVKQ